MKEEIGKIVLYDSKGNQVAPQELNIIQAKLITAVDLLRFYVYEHNQRAYAVGTAHCSCEMCVAARQLFATPSRSDNPFIKGDL